MLRFVIRRLLLLVPTLIGLSVLLFFWVRILPGDPARSLLGQTATPEGISVYATNTSTKKLQQAQRAAQQSRP